METAAMTDHIDTESVQSPVLALNFPETATFTQSTPSALENMWMNPLVGDIQAQEFSFHKKPEKAEKWWNFSIWPLHWGTILSDEYRKIRWLVDSFLVIVTAKLNHQSEKTNPKVFFFPWNDSKSDYAIMQTTRRKSDEYKQLNSKTTLTSPGTCVMCECIFSLSFLLLRSQSQKTWRVCFNFRFFNICMVKNSS